MIRNTNDNQGGSRHRFMGWAGATVLAVCSVGTAFADDPIYQEQGGLLVIEMEAGDAGGDWVRETSTSGYTGESYLRWDGPNLFNTPGQDAFGFSFDIHEAGTYQLRIRNRHDHGDSTEENDVWTRMDGGPWVKLFSWQRGQWTWASNHEFSHDDKPPAQYVLTEGRHTLEFSGRSHNFIMDRFHMFIEGTPGQTNPGSPVSPTLVENSPPVARFTTDPPSIPLGGQGSYRVTLDASTAFDPNAGQQLSYNWTVRGGRFVDGTGPDSVVARVEYSQPRSALPVRLQVWDDAEEPLTDIRYGVVNATRVGGGGADSGIVKGEPAMWHTLEVWFEGPTMNETDMDPNPFTDYRLDVTMRAPSGNSYTVPGFFAGDGEGGSTGNIWKVRFTADEPGLWRYQASFRTGTYAALINSPGEGEPTHFDGARGTIGIMGRDPQAEGFLSQGRLEYVGEHYLKFRDGGYFIKGGTNSPENLLGYKGFDDIQDSGGAGIIHEYGAHEVDFQAGDPYFENTATGFTSKCLIGALNYLSREHVNSVYFLPMNLGGDGQETYPFIGTSNNSFNKRHYDLSRMHQWSQVLDHATRRGILLHFVLGETEAPNETWLDGGNLGVDRRLFYREMIARFGHNLAVKWNLCEENDYSIEHLESFAGLISLLDVYDHPIAVHTHPDNFQDYEVIVGNPLFKSTSIQYHPDNANDHVENWREQSAATGQKWVIEMDEQGPWNTGLNDQNADDLRKRILYDVLFSGGNIEWYAGYHDLPLGGDLRMENFRTRQEMWRYMWYARRFMQDHLPFWEMEPADELLSGESSNYGGGQVFAKQGEAYAIYLPKALQTGHMNLSGTSGTFDARWFNPRSGAFQGAAFTLPGGQTSALPEAPNVPDQDWVLLLNR